MSTRATYRISEKFRENHLVNYFYIHYDGYPEGAVDYFKQLLDYRESISNKNRKTWAGCFKMGLPFSEKTIDHESHGDTEYRYNLSFWDGQMFLMVYECKLIGDTVDNIQEVWTRFFAGELAEFIELYGKKS